jgi:hypothetical protein
MIATLNLHQVVNQVDPRLTFLEMLPSIYRAANFAFRRKRRALREDFVAEVIANAFTAFKRLIERGKAQLAYPTVLARFAIRQVLQGRRVGSRLNINDVLSPYAQRCRQFHVQSLHRHYEYGHWEDLVVEDRRSTPAEVAACRLDFRAWLSRLDHRKREIALRLASGESTTEAASRLGVCPARISQFRTELRNSWQAFQGEQEVAT